MARALLSKGIVALFLVQALAILLSAPGRADLAQADGGASLLAAFCGGAAHDGDPTPADHRHHCDICPAGCDGSAAKAALAPSPRADTRAFGSLATPEPRRATPPAPFPSGWTSSWSSRAPPIRA
jgi:hypothetical protein